LNFRKEKVEKKRSFVKLPKITAIDNSTNAKFCNNRCCNMLLDAKVNQSQMIGLENKIEPSVRLNVLDVFP
jgi:hypothetical protein